MYGNHIWGNNGNSKRFFLGGGGPPKLLQMVTAAMKLRHLLLGRKASKDSYRKLGTTITYFLQTAQQITRVRDGGKDPGPCFQAAYLVCAVRSHGTDKDHENRNRDGNAHVCQKFFKKERKSVVAPLF